MIVGGFATVAAVAGTDAVPALEVLEPCRAGRWANSRGGVRGGGGRWAGDGGEVFCFRADGLVGGGEAFLLLADNPVGQSLFDVRGAEFDSSLRRRQRLVFFLEIFVLVSEDF